MNTTHDVKLPSGWEVESATLHPPMSDRSGMRARLETLKSRGLTKVQRVRNLTSERGLAVRDGAKSQVTKLQSSMSSNAMLWAGIAAATGLGLGLLGRVAHWRSKQRRVMPDLVIIEARCSVRVAGCELRGSS